MNDSPCLRNGDQRIWLTHGSCGIKAMRNVNDYFWQSRATLAGRRAEHFPTVDLKALATQIRRAYSLTAAELAP